MYYLWAFLFFNIGFLAANIFLLISARRRRREFDGFLNDIEMKVTAVKTLMEIHENIKTGKETVTSLH